MPSINNDSNIGPKSPTPSRPVAGLRSSGRAFFWIGVCGLLTGMGMSALPGFVRNWMLGCAILVAFGVFVPRIAYRVAAVILVLFSLYAAFDSHQRALQYGESWTSRESPILPK